MEILKDIIIEGQHGKPIMVDAFFEKTNMPKPVIVFSHGFKGFKDWGCWNLIGKRFADNGFVFVKFNFSHNGTTPEQPTDFADLEAFGNNNLSIELDDLGAVIDWIMKGNDTVPTEEADKDKLYLIGHSRGGGITILKANEDERVKKIITWASVANFERHWNIEIKQWQEQGVRYVENARTKQQMPMYYQLIEDYQKNRDRLHVLSAAKKIRIPFLIMHGDEDTAVPIQDAIDLDKLALKSTLLRIPGTNHTFGSYHPYNSEGLPADTNRIVDESIQFLKG